MEPIDVEALYIRAGFWTATQIVKPLNALLNHLVVVKSRREETAKNGALTAPEATLGVMDLAPPAAHSTSAVDMTPEERLCAMLPVHGRTKKIDMAADTPEQSALMDKFPGAFELDVAGPDTSSLSLPAQIELPDLTSIIADLRKKNKEKPSKSSKKEKRAKKAQKRAKRDK